MGRIAPYRHLLLYLAVILTGGWISLLSGCKEKVTSRVVVEELVKSSHSWEGSLLPAYPEGTPEISILKITIPPKTSLNMHMHPVINAGFLAQGSLRVITEKQDTLYLETGQAIVEVVDQWHYGSNVGKIPAVIYVFYAGVEGMPVSVAKD